MRRSLRILLVDDHTLFSDSLAGVLQRLGEQVEVEQAATCERALEVLGHEKAVPFDLVLLDLGLPGLHGTAAFRAIKNVAGDTALVIVTGKEAGPEALELLRAGARGYAHKRVSSDELVSVLRFVLDGGTYIPQVVLESPDVGEASLTPRQREVLGLLARGVCNKDIAATLGISAATVRVHVSSVMRALGVENRTQAATSALGRALADAD